MAALYRSNSRDSVFSLASCVSGIGGWQPGDRCILRDLKGTVAFVGHTKFATGEWIGICLDEKNGKNDGSVDGERYFEVEDGYGIFARANKLERPRPSPSLMGSPSALRHAPISQHAAQYGFDIGDRVLCGSGKSGIVRYLDTTDFALGVWAGIELTSGVGKNDGSVQGRRYFECDAPKGLFMLASKVTKAPTAAPTRYAVRHNKSSVLRHGGLQRVGSQESLASFGASSIASSRMFTPKIVRKPNINLNLGNSYEQTIKTLQESLKEKETHLEKVLRERESDHMEIARLTSMKCTSPTSFATKSNFAADDQDRVKELEAEINRLTNELAGLTKTLEELTFNLEEERANSQCVEERAKELEAQIEEMKTKDLIDIEIPEASNKTIEQLRNELQKQKDEIERHIVMYEKLNAEFGESKHRCENISKKNDEVTTELDHLKELSEILEESKSSALSERDEAKKALSAAIEDKDRHETEKSELASKLDGAAIEVQQLSEVVKKLQQSEASALADLTSLKESGDSTVKNLLAERDEAKEAIKHLKSSATDSSRILKEKEELQEKIDRLNSSLSHRDQLLESERQQTKMLQGFIKKMNEDMKKKEEGTQKTTAIESTGSVEELKAEIEKLCEEKAAIKADLSQKIDLFLDTDNMRERREKENRLRIEELEKELTEAKVKKSDNVHITELEQQVEFSNSIIASQQHKIDKLSKEINQIKDALGEEGMQVEYEEKKKKKKNEKPVRRYCDICEEFDKHETEDCPSQTLGAEDVERHQSLISLAGTKNEEANLKKHWIRKFCDHCDQFDLHDTEDCPNPQF